MERDLREIRRLIVGLYPKTLEPYGLHEGTIHEEVLRKRIRWHIPHIPKTSKPGVPLMTLGDVNHDILSLKENLELVVDATIQRLKLLSELDCTGLSGSDMVRRGLCDPVRMFIKDEPHPLKKQKSKRWRLIMAISAVDQLVERLLCSAQNKEEIAQWKKIPSAPGISLTDDSALEAFRQRINSYPGTTAEADVTGWDWSVKEWELLLEADMRADLCDASDWLRRIFRNRELCVSHAVYALPDGTLVDKAVPGVQCSGRYNTSSTNSRLRVMLAHLCGASWACAMGDDCVEQYHPDAAEKYNAFGHPLKMYNEVGEDFEFCSLKFTAERVYPVDGTKALYNLLEQKELTDEFLDQFCMEMRNHPRKSEFLASVERVRGGTVGK